MENKPVIILGGGLWGGLLAFRLAETLPMVNFILYEKNSNLGGNQTWFFHENELDVKALSWIYPLIDKSWDGHRVHFPGDSRSLGGKYHSISSKKFHQVILSSLQSKNLKLNNEIPIELAVREGSFVIDTRNICLIKNVAYQKCVGIEVELEMEHGLEQPIMLDAMVNQEDGYHFLSYFPLSSRVLLVRDTRYSKDQNLNSSEIKSEMGKRLKAKGWTINKILREENKISPIPLSTPFIREEGRIVSLGGIFHDSTGHALPDAVKLIDLMVRSSFRFGELKTIVSNFRRKKENQRIFFRLWNRFVFESNDPHDSYKMFQKIYQLPDPVIQKFNCGELDLWDKSRIFIQGSSVFLT